MTTYTVPVSVRVRFEQTKDGHYNVYVANFYVGMGFVRKGGEFHFYESSRDEYEVETYPTVHAFLESLNKAMLGDES